MEVSTPLKEYVDELIKCPICLDGLVDPKSLPCLHTFCLKCVKDHCKHFSQGNQVTCPVCRSPFVIPKSGVEQLTSNFFINGLVEASKAAGGKADKVMCDSCCEFGDISLSNVPEATLCCAGCGQKLCDRCSRPHQKIPGGAHQVVSLGSDATKDLLKIQGSFCDVHPGNKLEIYCNRCHITACVTCHVLKHREHDCKDINDVYKTFCTSLTRDVEQVAAGESSFIQEVSYLETSLKQYFDGVEGIEKEVLDTATDLKRRIDEAVNRLMLKLSEKKTVVSKITSDVKSELEFAVAASQSFIRYSTELLNRGKPSDVTRAYHNLHERAIELSRRNLKSGRSCLPEVGVSANDLLDELADFMMNTTTRVSTLIRQQRNQVAEFATTPGTLKLIHSMEEGEPIFGATTLNKELYMKYGDNTDITIYDSETYIALRTLHVPRLGIVNDMTSCKRHQCIYISDYGNNIVHRVDNKNTITQWPVNDEPHALSVNSLHNVLVTCYVVGKVKEFTTDGKLVREINLDSSIVNPGHAVELTTGQLVVCHGDSDDEVHRLCIVDMSGHILRSYGWSKGSAGGQVNTPIRLAVNGVIFVADLNNDRVLMFSPTLRLIRKVVSDLDGPLGMWFDDESGRLFVADNCWKDNKWASGRINVYGV